MDSSASAGTITTTTDPSVPENAGEYPGCHLAAYFASRGVELSREEAKEVLHTFVRLAELGALVPADEAAPHPSAFRSARSCAALNPSGLLPEVSTSSET
jgi:hypothetical protein